MQGPKYDFDEFIKGCSAGTARVRGKALQTARMDFGLKTERDVVTFISCGLERPRYHSTAPLETNPYSVVVHVDNYYFFSGSIYGYLSFFQNPNDALWIIKSMKKNEQVDPRYFSFKAAFEKKRGY